MNDPAMTAIAARLGLGGAGIGNHRVALDDAQARRVLEEAWATGVRLFDTAPHYGLGLSERRLGDFLRSVPRESFRISTKVGRRLVPREGRADLLDDEGFLVPATHDRVWDFTAAGIRATLEASLTRLGVDRVDVVYLHDPERWDLEWALRQGLPVLQDLREEGLVGAIGVGSMRADALVAAARTGAVDELMVAARYTLLDRTAADELLPMCEELGIRVVAAAVLHGGFLAEAPSAHSTYDYAVAPAGVTLHAAEIARMCAEAGVPLAAAALQFPLRHPAVDSVVVGAVEPGQIAEALRLLATPVPDALWEALDDRQQVLP
jgi:D-threo-aldose 1-dehydrogenase